ncbi:MAG: hypothetical protein PVG65_04630, partial [Candidatus Thorarchaeota archaeon]
SGNRIIPGELGIEGGKYVHFSFFPSSVVINTVSFATTSATNCANEKRKMKNKKKMMLEYFFITTIKPPFF